ncbi:hypothetical protein FM104_14510 [Microbacterium esteraromaticum]|uniref:DUF937 domain-containing protein n=1 Tax=Microbacterium esteraromaticum TaxID=57043 RepID=A0A1R4KP75_9MICO|nr:DUF937 domain-containing protein [Microbacterium esteraromaticum]SJN46049.1 hypothetical protein FM104_14510 [Microbacterium esteraromaticum]
MDFDAILKQVPIGDIAERFGVSPDVARQAVQEGGAALLGGLAKNAETAEGSSAIEQALSRHEGFNGASKVDDIDTADGDKIVKHVFGNKEKEVVNSLTESKKTAGGIDFGKLLPVLAPIVMGLIANATKGKSTGGGGGLGDILGGLLGGGQNEQSSGGGGLGDILGGLGGMFGGGQQSGSNSGGNVVGDILGGLFGKK